MKYTIIYSPKAETDLRKHAKTPIWSRNIDDRHRMLYIVDNEKSIIFVISLWGHYDDK